MAETMAEGATPTRKRAILPLVGGAVGAIVLGAGGFHMAYSGLIPTWFQSDAAPDPVDGLAFVRVDPIVVSLPAKARASHLRLTAQLEVGRDQAAPVTALMPRIVDVLNSYLRAVDTPDIEDPAALSRLRAQMLRRVQLVVGDGRVRDLLITEFVLN